MQDGRKSRIIGPIRIRTDIFLSLSISPTFFLFPVLFRQNLQVYISTAVKSLTILVTYTLIPPPHSFQIQLPLTLNQLT